MNGTEGRSRTEPEASVAAAVVKAPAADDEKARRMRLPLLSKGAVVGHRFDRPLATEMDD